MDRRFAGAITWLTRHRTGLAFSLAAGLLLVVVVIAVGARNVVEQYEAVRHTSQVVDRLDGLLAAVTDAETGNRGFLLTGDERYLAPYVGAANAARAHLRELSRLSAGDARRERSVEVLGPLVADKLGHMQVTVDLAREGRAEAARQRLLTGDGLRLMEEIRAEVVALRTQERRIEAEQSTAYSRQARDVFLALAVLAAVILVLVAIVLVEYRRRVREIGVTRDALQSQAVEHEKTSALLVSIVQSSDDAIIGLGLDGRVVTWNAGAERLYGYPSEEIREQPIGVLAPDPAADTVGPAVRRVGAEGALERLEAEQMTRDQQRVHVLLTVSPIRDVAGAVVGISIVARDLTAQERAERSRRRSEATSRTFIESASEAIVVADTAGRIVLVNARTERMFGYTRAELVGQPVELLVPRPLRERHVAHRASYMAAPRVRSMGQGLDLAGLKKDGSEFPVEVSLSYVETDEGLRAIAFITDISERVAFQRAARQADKLAALGTLSAGIAHEINNPIGIITSRVEVMLLEGAEGELPPETRKDLDVILRHARRVAAITQGLLSFARQSSGARGPVNLNQVAEEIVQLTRKDMSRARIEVALKLDETMPTIVADANAIGQVLLNLLTNAWRAMPEGGEVSIETTHLVAAGTVRLTVRDTGPGIPPEILPKIFDPFFTTKPDGTGLGLSISHGIVQDHRGTLSVRSEVGKGSAFTLSFPLDVPAAGRRPEMEEWRGP